MSRDRQILYRTCTPVTSAEFDPVDGPPLIEAIVEALADAADVGPTQLPPLYEVVDLDDVAQLFSNHTGPDTVYSFRFDVWQVFVRGDGLVSVCDRSMRTDPEPLFAGVRNQ